MFNDNQQKECEPSYKFIPGAVLTSYKQLYKTLKDLGQLQCLENAFNKLCPFFLVSFGDLYPLKQSLAAKKATQDKELASQLAEKVVESYFSLFSLGGQLFLDSGGYQISMGRVGEEHLPQFLGTYYEFVTKLHNMLDDKLYLFFYLDAILGESGVLKNFDSITQWCKTSLDFLRESHIHETPELWNKFAFIVHCNSIQRYRIWKQIEQHLELTVKRVPVKFSVGGLVAGGHRFRHSHILHWVYGLLYIMEWLRKQELFNFSTSHSSQPITSSNKILFHILGVVEVSYVISLFVVGEYLYTKYRIPIDFTYDGTGFLKKSMMGRLMGYIDPATLSYYNVSFNSKQYKQSLPGCKDVTVDDYLLSLFREIWDLVGYEPIDSDGASRSVYQYPMGPYQVDCGLWICFLETLFQRKVQQLLLPVAKKVAQELAVDSLHKWDYLLEFINGVLGKLSIETKVTLYKQIKNSLLLIDKMLESPQNFNWEEDVFLPSFTVTESFF